MRSRRVLSILSIPPLASREGVAWLCCGCNQCRQLTAVYRRYLQKENKAPFYTWVIWTPLTFIAFFSQLAGNAGPGAWTTGVTAMLCLVILMLAIPYGTKDITKSDKITLFATVIASMFYLGTKDALMSIVLVTLIDVAAFLPTIRKSIKKPFEETLSTHLLSGCKHFISLFALEKINILTVLYPFAVSIANLVLVVVLVICRRNK